MTTILIITEHDDRREAWTAAARAAGHDVRLAPALIPGIDLLGTQPIDGVLVDAEAAGELERLVMLSVFRPTPPTVIVHDRSIAVPARMRAAACRPSTTPPDRLVHLLGRLIAHRELAQPTNLPVRVTPLALKWTSRLSSIGDDDDTGETNPAFDGETNDDGFDLAAR
ncbi:MAG: hypothetical protein HS111_03905 [Kofleriaceae bacterium]|nr:hypothetical protein [Kofleriaceae bacterium]MCL4228048.1 hypothetical protein [Myxococcales bacterium]